MNTSVPPHLVPDHTSRSDHFCFSSEQHYLIFDDSSKINWIFIATIYAIGGLFAMILNVGYLLLITVNRRLQKLSNYLLALLSAVDTLMAFVVMPGASFCYLCTYKLNILL